MSQQWPESIVVYTDGASRGNPGPASIGIHFIDENNQTLEKIAEAIGDQTNNYAEYSAVIRALEFAHKNGVKSIVLRSDSELLIRQITGVYRVKSPVIYPLFRQCQILIKKFHQITFEHVRREYNKEADRLANLALDGMSAV